MFLKKFSWQAALLFGAISMVACKGECGDGTIDAENKDGNAETCDDGNVVPEDGCDNKCIIEIPPENCAGGVDEDQDGLIDCADPECAAAATCVANSCGFNELSGEEIDPDLRIPLNIVEGQAQNQSNSTADGVSATVDGSCQLAVGGGGGLDIVFELTVPSAGNLIADLTSPGDDNANVDNGIMIHTVCNDDAGATNGSEIACGDVDFNAGEVEQAAAALQAGGTVFLTVGAFTAGSEGNFELTINFAGFVAEDNDANCGNGIDDDGDGTVDCEDADCGAIVACIEDQNCNDFNDNDVDLLLDCQDDQCVAAGFCTPGANALGAVCTVNTDCSTASGEDPSCFTDANVALGIPWPGGYCSEFCAADADCGAGNICLFATGDGTNDGLCLDGCTVDTDCEDADLTDGLCDDGTTACNPADPVACVGIGDEICDPTGSGHDVDVYNCLDSANGFAPCDAANAAGCVCLPL